MTQHLPDRFWGRIASVGEAADCAAGDRSLRIGYGGRVVRFDDGDLNRARRHLALFPSLERERHLRLALASFIRDPNRAVKLTSSATLIKRIPAMERSLTRLSDRELHIDEGTEPRWE